MKHVCPECGDSGDAGLCAADGANRIPAGADTLLGTTIGSWRVARLLGAGGMGKVYVAVQPQIGARVAIKVLKREMAADELVVERFFNEARAVNLIKHEAIVDVIDLGQLPDGAPYIVMEFLEGASLGTILRREKKLPLGTLARIVAEILAALDAAHTKGIIHRDLKPDNVFVSPGGRVTVLDFGIAKLAARDGGVGTTQTNSLLGTPAYMAPEQARSQPLDARADLYAVGVMLYEAATGALPFRGENVFDLLQLHVTAIPEPPSRRADVPGPFEAVILRALAKDPTDRFASATDMRDALLAAADGMPQVALSSAVFALPASTRVKSPSEALAATAAAPSTRQQVTQATNVSLAHRETQESLARGETLPAPSTPDTTPAAPATVQISKRLLFGLVGGAALLGLGGAAVMVMLANDKPAPQQTAQLPPTTPPPPTESPPQTTTPPPIDTAPQTDPPPSTIATHPPPAHQRTQPVSPPPPRSTLEGRPEQPKAKQPPALPPGPTGGSGSPIDAGVAARPTFKGRQSKVSQGPVAHVRVIELANPSSFDPMAYWSEAEKIAQDLFGTTNTSRGMATFYNVDRDGKLDVASGNGKAIYHFYWRDAYKEGNDHCVATVKIMMDAEGNPNAIIGSTALESCKPRGSIVAQCSMQELWAKATALGAPAEGKAVLNRTSSRGWHLTIEKPTKWDSHIDDDCTK